jgi:hypothetical protein
LLQLTELIGQDIHKIGSGHGRMLYVKRPSAHESVLMAANNTPLQLLRGGLGL